jgi:putative transposase
MTGKIKSVVVSRTPSNKYFVSVLYEVKDDYFAKLPKTGKQVGLDIGLKHFLTLSEGVVVSNPRFDKGQEKKIVREQRKLARRKTRAIKEHRKLDESRNYQKQKVKVARLHEKVANQRNDFGHKLSLSLVKSYDLIAVEDLSIKDMKLTDETKKATIQKKRTNRAYDNAGIAEFIRKLTYKAKWYGKQVVTINKDYPSSQICSVCKMQLKEPLPLTRRVFRCSSCKLKLDRDLNAARNILAEAMTTVGTTGIAH